MSQSSNPFSQAKAKASATAQEPLDNSASGGAAVAQAKGAVGEAESGDFDWVLGPQEQNFIRHFGEMGSRWGINRAVGKIYGFVFLAPQPVNADQIVEQLHFSRSGVSMGLKELQSWRLLRSSYKRGDRREYYSALEDTWDIFKVLLEERQRREIEPTLVFLRNTLKTESSESIHPHAHARMQEMHDLIQLGTGWLADLSRLERKTLEKAMYLGSKALKKWT